MNEYIEDYALQDIKGNIEVIQQAWQQVEKNGTDEQKQTFSNNIKSAIQHQALKGLSDNNGYGAIYMATGTGKSKVAILKAEEIVKSNPKAKILLVVPTIKLRDQGWMQEFHKWGFEQIWEHNIERTCYASIHNYKNDIWDLVIFDEGHNITEKVLDFRLNNGNWVESCILLTATKPKDKNKLQYISKLGLSTVYTFSLDEAVSIGLVAPYEIIVVSIPLNTKDRNIKSGNAQKIFYQTEQAKYNYVSKGADDEAVTDADGITTIKKGSKMAKLNRMKFIKELPSKQEAALWIRDNIIPVDKRGLIFCGSKDQANVMCPYRFYSRPTRPKTVESYNQDQFQKQLDNWQGDEFLVKFQQKLINQLSCVDALNEGQNIEDMDYAFMIHTESGNTKMEQRLGRTIRFRPSYLGKVIMLVAEGTVDTYWNTLAIKNLDKSKITRITLDQLKQDYNLINFN